MSKEKELGASALTGDQEKKEEGRREKRRAFFEAFLQSLDDVHDPEKDDAAAQEELPADEVPASAEEPAEEPETVTGGEAASAEEPAPEGGNEDEKDPFAPFLKEDTAEEKPEEPPAEEPPAKEDGDEDVQVISDEELAKLLATVGLQEQDAPKKDKDETPSDESENTQVFHEKTDVDEGTRVFQTEGAEETEPDGEEPSAEQEDEAGDDDDGEDDEYDARDFRPFRRRRNYRTGCMGGIMYFVMLLCISIALASLCWLAANDVLSLNKKEVEAVITVPEDFTIKEVARQLGAEGIIEYPALFELFSKFSKAQEKIDPGTYELSSKLDYRAIVTNLQKSAGELRTVKVTIPEGKTLRQTFELLEENEVCSVDDLMTCAAEYAFEYTFIGEPGEATRLEGYLFPDTYEFYVNSSPEGAIKKFLDNFSRRVPEEMMEQAEQLGYTFHEVLTVASMIEMEAAADSERPVIASVIYNRLASSDFPYLQVDATVQYALGERKESLTYSDLEIDSPYNTYKYEGLPPGPISNPGLASIRAALGPEDTNYYYYALNTSGVHEFFRYYSAFEAFVNSSDFGG